MLEAALRLDDEDLGALIQELADRRGARVCAPGHAGFDTNSHGNGVTTYRVHSIGISSHIDNP